MVVYQEFQLPNTGFKANLDDFVVAPINEDGGDAWQYWSGIEDFTFAILDDGRLLHLGVGGFNTIVDGVNVAGALVMDDLVFNPTGAVVRSNPRHFHDEAAGQSGRWLVDGLSACLGCVALPGDYVIAFYEASTWNTADFWGILIYWPAGGQSQVVDTYAGFYAGGDDWTAVPRADRSNGVVLATNVNESGFKFKFWNFSHTGGTLSVTVSTIDYADAGNHMQATCAVVDGTERMFFAHSNKSTSQQEVMAASWSGDSVISGPVVTGDFTPLFPEAVNDGGIYDPEIMTWGGQDRSKTSMAYLNDGVVAWMSVVNYNTPNVYEGADRWDHDFYGLIGCRATFSSGSWSAMNIERINDNINKFAWGPPIVHVNNASVAGNYAVGVVTRSNQTSNIIDYVLALRISQDEFAWDVIPMNAMLDAVDRWWGVSAYLYPSLTLGSKLLTGHSLYVPKGTNADPGDTVGAWSTVFVTIDTLDSTFDFQTGPRTRRFKFATT